MLFRSEVLAKAAQTEFDSLLKQGATYIDYLKRQRDEILTIDISERSKEQTSQLKALNNQIAEETKQTVLDAFNRELSEQLSNAKTTLEILNIIAQKRKELSGDGTEMDNTKKESLDNAEKDAIAQQKQDTDALLDDYASYLDKKLQMEMQYTNDIVLLEKRRAEATTDADKARIDTAINNRTQQYKSDSRGSGDADYDAMVQQYARFEQKKQSVIDEYDDKRQKALMHGNEQLVQQLDEAQAKAMSKLALDELQVKIGRAHV